ncbi:MAG: DUF4783 domain-containing protein [Rhodothermales bacterium]
MSEIKKFFIYTCLVGALVWLSAPVKLAHAHLQTDPGETIAKVQRAISKGDAQAISRFTSSYTEVSILGATTMYSRAQTAYILKAFFRDHPPARFSFQHKLRVGSDWYIRGQYQNRGRESPYRMEMTMHWNGQQFEIKSISIKALESR